MRKLVESNNGHRKIAARNIKYAYEYIVGGYENMYYDHYLGGDMKKEEFPTIDEVKAEIYQCAFDNYYAPGTELSHRAPKEMRFAGREFAKSYIDKLFAQEDEEWLKQIFN